MERAAIYNRCSTEEEAQKNALAIQAEESRERAAELGWEVTAQYIEAESGTDARKRTQYQRLLEDMEKDLFDIIMIKSIDRLMRSARDWYLFLDRLTVNHQRLYIYIDNKFYQPEDNLISGIKAILAEDFSRELSKKIKNAHRRRQEKKSGLNITVPMFGWDKQGKDHYVLNKQESDWYRMAFSLVENGMGFYRLSNYMFELGVRGKKGERISQVQWRKMLTSPRAYGTVVLHTREYDFDEKRYRTLPRKDWIYVEEAIPGIVDKGYFERVQKMIHSRNRRKGDSGRDSGRGEQTKLYMGRYAFSGKVFCKECGSICYRIKKKTVLGRTYTGNVKGQ